MASLSERMQVGPMRLEGLVALLVAIAANPGREPELIKEARRALLVEKEAAKRRAIKAAFGDLGGKGGLAWNESVLLSLPPEDVGFCLGPDGSPDYLAAYLPWHGREERSGIYFIRRTLLSAARRIPKAAHPAFFRALAVHELFHYHAERLVGDDAAYSGHSCTPWCELEEAGANFAARSFAQSDPASLSAFDSILFRKREDGGLRGYGEYHLLDERIIPAIGRLKMATIGACLSPARFQARMAEVLLEPGILGGNGDAAWAATLAAADSGDIAFYYDMLN
jgi:hypothetical protein